MLTVARSVKFENDQNFHATIVNVVFVWPGLHCARMLRNARRISSIFNIQHISQRGGQNTQHVAMVWPGLHK